jgi:hypothetical protein
MKWLKGLLVLLVLVAIGIGIVEAKGMHGKPDDVPAPVNEAPASANVEVNVPVSTPYEHNYEHHYNESCPTYEHHEYKYNYSHEYNKSCETCNKSMQAPHAMSGMAKHEQKGLPPIEEIKKREIALKNIQKAKEKYLLAKKKYAELKHRGLQDPETFRHAKIFIGSGIEVAKMWIERLMVKVQYANIGEEEKNRIMTKLENCLGLLQSIENRINESEKPEQLRANVKSLKENWSQIMVVVKSTVGQLAVAKLEVLINKLENITVKVETEIPENNTKLVELLNDCKEKIELAKEKLELAKEKFTAMETADNPNKLYLEGKKLIIEAKDLIRIAFKDLREIYIELKVIT